MAVDWAGSVEFGRPFGGLGGMHWFVKRGGLARLVVGGLSEALTWGLAIEGGDASRGVGARGVEGSAVVGWKSRDVDGGCSTNDNSAPVGISFSASWDMAWRGRDAGVGAGSRIGWLCGGRAGMAYRSEDAENHRYKVQGKATNRMSMGVVRFDDTTKMLGDRLPWQPSGELGTEGLTG